MEIEMKGVLEDEFERNRGRGGQIWREPKKEIVEVAAAKNSTISASRSWAIWL